MYNHTSMYNNDTNNNNNDDNDNNRYIYMNMSIDVYIYIFDHQYLDFLGTKWDFSNQPSPYGCV